MGKGKMFQNIRCFVLDMDGTIYLGNQLFPYTLEFLKRVKETGRKYYFTNNSSKSQEEYVRKLKKSALKLIQSK